MCCYAHTGMHNAVDVSSLPRLAGGLCDCDGRSTGGSVVRARHTFASADAVSDKWPRAFHYVRRRPIRRPIICSDVWRPDGILNFRLDLAGEQNEKH